MTTIQSLISYLNQHSVVAWEMNGRLFAIQEYSDATNEAVEIEATFPAVRAWLGY